MKVLVTGDRNWTDGEKIEAVLLEIAGPVLRSGGTFTVIQGGQRGADILARKVAEKYGWTSITEPAKWDLYGKAAGPIRNRKMFDTYQPDLVVAFHPNLDKSKGTVNMVRYANSKNASMILISA